jgi:hypothetical protein
MVKVSGVKALATTAALDINSGVFEVIGARGTHPKFGFDRFWRNVRTHTLHDPVSYKIADVGKHTSTGSVRFPASPLEKSEALTIGPDKAAARVGDRHHRSADCWSRRTARFPLSSRARCGL